MYVFLGDMKNEARGRIWTRGDKNSISAAIMGIGDKGGHHDFIRKDLNELCDACLTKPVSRSQLLQTLMTLWPHEQEQRQKLDEDTDTIVLKIASFKSCNFTIWLVCLANSKSSLTVSLHLWASCRIRSASRSACVTTVRSACVAAVA